jgi:hypothetical protein
MTDGTSANESWRRYPCKIWTGAINGKGYGHRGVNGKDRLVHREALEQKLGRPILPGMQANHHCDVPICYEPEHLYEGSQARNMRDTTERRRCVNMHGPQKLTPADRDEIRRLYALGGITHRELGAMYGVDRRTITGAMRRF